jgi:hypothetical protein
VPDRLAPEHEDVEMRSRLEHSENPVERAEFCEASPASSRPAEHLGAAEGVARAGDEGRTSIREPSLVVAEEFVRPRVSAPSRRPVRGQQHRVRKGQHPKQ